MPDGGSHITILGAGFAALRAARELRKRAPKAFISLLAPKSEFVYLPSLIWLPSGLRRSEDLIVPLLPFLERHRINYCPCSVAGLKDGGRTVITDQGEVHNDALIIATGGRFIKGLPGIEHALTLCEGISAAEEISKRLQAMPGGHLAFGFGGNPKEPSAMRGGPMFELLFGVDTLLRQQGRREAFELSFFNAAEEPGKRLGAKAVHSLLGEMQQRGIKTYLGGKIIGFSPSHVQTETTQLLADLILFMPGLAGPEWAQNTDLELSPGGFFQADEFCAVKGGERVWVAGDAGSYPGPDWLPKQAHMAELQAKAAAQNLLLTLAGEAPRARPRAELICIVDSLNSGTLIYRDPKRSWILPPSRLLHWAKRYFEGHYLRQLR